MNPQDEALSVTRQDDFQGDTPHLIACIDALLDLDDAKALVPHGLGKGSHAYRLLCAARHRLSHSTPGDAEVREALADYDATVKRCPANTQFLGDRKCPRCSAGPDEGCRQEIRAAGDVITAVRTFLATPSGRAQGEVVAWMYERSDGRFFLHPSEPDFEHEDREFHKRKGWTETPLYAAPPAQDQKGEER